MTTIYRIIPVENNKISQYRKASEVASFLLGRRVTAYIIIKTDEFGSRVVSFDTAPDFFVTTIQEYLEKS